MANIAHPHVTPHLHAHRNAIIAALLALAATAAVVLVIAIDGGGTTTAVSPAEPLQRPSESATAAAIGAGASATVARPDEGRVAASISRDDAVTRATRPSESATAAAIGGGASKPSTGSRQGNASGLAKPLNSP